MIDRNTRADSSSRRDSNAGAPTRTSNLPNEAFRMSGVALLALDENRMEAMELTMLAQQALSAQVAGETSHTRRPSSGRSNKKDTWSFGKARSLAWSKSNRTEPSRPVPRDPRGSLLPGAAFARRAISSSLRNVAKPPEWGNHPRKRPTRPRFLDPLTPRSANWRRCVRLS